MLERAGFNPTKVQETAARATAEVQKFLAVARSPRIILMALIGANGVHASVSLYEYVSNQNIAYADAILRSPDTQANPQCSGQLDHTVRFFQEGNGQSGFQPNSTDKQTNVIVGASMIYKDASTGQAIKSNVTNNKGEAVTDIIGQCVDTSDVSGVKGQQGVKINFEAKIGSRVETGSTYVPNKQGHRSNFYIQESQPSQPPAPVQTATSVPARPTVGPTVGPTPGVAPSPDAADKAKVDAAEAAKKVAEDKANQAATDKTNAEADRNRWALGAALLGLLAGFSIGGGAVYANRRRALETERTARTTAETNLTTRTAELATANTDLANMTTDRDTEHTARTAAETALAARTGELATANADLVAMTDERDDEHTARTAAETALAPVTTQRDVALGERDVARGQVAALNGEAVRLQGILDAIRPEVANIRILLAGASTSAIITRLRDIVNRIVPF